MIRKVADYFIMKYFPTLFLSFFASEFCAFIPNKLEDKSNLRKSEAKYYIIHILVLTKPDSVKQVLWASLLMLWYFYLECKCNKDGSMVITKCESDGQCSCKDNIVGKKCDACKDEFYNFPTCRG